MNRLKDLREDRDMSQAEVGKAIGVSTMSISHYERGERALTDDLIVKFCKLFGVTSDYLLGLSTRQQPAVSKMDTAILAAYHAAPADIQAIIDTALAPYKQEHGAGAAAS